MLKCEGGRKRADGLDRGNCPNKLVLFATNCSNPKPQDQGTITRQTFRICQTECITFEQFVEYLKFNVNYLKAKAPTKKTTYRKNVYIQ